MKYTRQVVTGVAGTLMMTLFSHILSKIFGRVFEEQRQLEKMINRGSPAGKYTSHILGWILHLGMGQVFSYLNIKAAESTGQKPNPLNSLLYGAADGIVGVIIWRLNFLLHPNPPKVSLRKYLIQLFFAHLVFGFFHGLMFQVMQKKLK